MRKIAPFDDRSTSELSKVSSLAAAPSLPIQNELPSSAEVWPSLEGLMRDRLRKCVTLLPKVLGEDDPEVVHDMRVWSRRLQQVIVTIFPEPMLPEARAMIRTLRRTRRSLGGWRDCDVVIALLQRRVRATRGQDLKQAWEFVLETARRKLERRMRRARARIANRKMFTLAQRGRELIEQRRAQNNQVQVDPLASLASSVTAAYDNWRDGLARAKSSTDPLEIHAFRIQTKRLRYRIELFRDLGSSSAKAALASLKTLQDELGRWHDNLAFMQITAEGIADPDFLIEHSRTAAFILRKLDRDDARHLKRVRHLLGKIDDEADASPLHAATIEFRELIESKPSPDSALSSEAESKQTPDLEPV